MRHFTFAFIALVVSRPASAELYQWSLSASPGDPFVNTGAPTPGLQTLHLWFACSEIGALGAEFSFELSPPAILVQVNPLGPHTFAPTGFLFLGDCTVAPERVAELLIVDPLGGFTACFTPSATQTLGTIDCDPSPELHPMAFVGFASDGTSPCSEGQCSGAVPVDGTSWGSVKTLYR